jgi:hypothetical protein
MGSEHSDSHFEWEEEENDFRTSAIHEYPSTILRKSGGEMNIELRTLNIERRSEENGKREETRARRRLAWVGMWRGSAFVGWLEHPGIRGMVDGWRARSEQ